MEVQPGSSQAPTASLNLPAPRPWQQLGLGVTPPPSGVFSGGSPCRRARIRSLVRELESLLPCTRVKKTGWGGVNSPLIYLVYVLMVNTHTSFSSILDQVVYTDYFRPNNRDTPLAWVTSGSQGTLGGGEGWLCS